MPERHPAFRPPLRVLHRGGRTGALDLNLTLPEVRVATFAALPNRVLHDILKLRQDVFVVEQQCSYMDMDGRDAEPAARHLWIESEDRVVSALRLLDDGGGLHRIGRVVTAAEQRGRGLAAALMRSAITLAGPPLVLSAQAYLREWYARFGFAVCGDGWDDAGIWHLPMRLEVAASG